MSVLDTYSRKELEDIVLRCYSMSDVIRELGYAAKSGDLYSTIKKRLDLDGISTSHFTKQSPVKRSVSNIFVKNSTASQRTLRSWIVKHNLLPYHCAICGMEPVWNGKPLSLTLDHIDGDNRNDELTNLRWVCPNCDRQLETFGSKNCVFVKKPDNHCIDCGVVIGRKAVRCKSCAGIERERKK